MLRRLFTVTGVIELSRCSVTARDQILDAAAKVLVDAKASKMRREPTGVHFRGGLLRGVPNWNVLMSIDSGKIWVTTDNAFQLHYEISFLQLFVASIALPAAAKIGNPDAFPIWMMLLTSTLLFGANFIVTLFRFSRLMARIAATVVPRVTKQEVACTDSWADY
jgi:hypothetical protein